MRLRPNLVLAIAALQRSILIERVGDAILAHVKKLESRSYCRLQSLLAIVKVSINYHVDHLHLHHRCALPMHRDLRYLEVL